MTEPAGHRQRSFKTLTLLDAHEERARLLRQSAAEHLSNIEHEMRRYTEDRERIERHFQARTGMTPETAQADIRQREQELQS